MLWQKLLGVVLKLLLFLLWRSGGLPFLVRCEMGTMSVGGAPVSSGASPHPASRKGKPASFALCAGAWGALAPGMQM